MILKRLKVVPDYDALTPGESHYVLTTFDIYAGEVVVNGQPVRWNELTEVEVVKAARYGGLSGWLVRHLVHGEDRYHVGLYAGEEEYILTNVTLNTARYVVQSVAYYAPQPVRYTGIDGLSPLIETG
ncbi:MAG: hypothetical protein H6672_00285 [Anaerolineaceae bacterium]|nr:hypothetical protein [Anaerolineaceae bacterium]